MAYVKKMSCKSEEIVNLLRKSRRKDKNEIQYIQEEPVCKTSMTTVFLGESGLGSKELPWKIATSPERN